MTVALIDRIDSLSIKSRHVTFMLVAWLQSFILAACLSTTASFSVSQSWELIGPVSVADVRQLDQDVWGPKRHGTVPSTLHQGGRTTWRRVVADGRGVVGERYGDGVGEVIAWAVGELKASEAGDVCVDVQGTVSNAFVADLEVPTTQVASTSWRISVTKGEHTIRLRLSGNGGIQFRAGLAPCGGGGLQVVSMGPGGWETGPGKWELGPRAYDLPDIIEGHIFSPLVSLRVANWQNQWLRDVRLSVGKSRHVQQCSEEHCHMAPSQPVDLAPDQITILSVLIRATDEFGEGGLVGAACPVSVPLVVRYRVDGTSKDMKLKHTLQLRCRVRKDSFQFLFQDGDGSPQMAAARLPTAGSSDDKLTTLVTFHGMDATASRAADCYQPKDNTWVLAPHGRSTSAFFWQGPGWTNVELALQALTSHSARIFPNETAPLHRLIATGHSNGGYGAWFLATTRPDDVLGLAPLAGMPTLSGRGASWSDPRLSSIMSAATSEYRADTPIATANFAGVAFLARTGAEDRTISPASTRVLSRLVCEGARRHDGDKCKMHELPGKEHWWWDTEKPSDGGVMDDQQMKDFFSRVTRKKKVPVPRNFAYYCYNPASCTGRGGFLITGQTTPFQLSSLHVDANESHTVITSNIARLFVPSRAHNVSLDGRNIELSEEHGVEMCRDDGGSWRRCDGVCSVGTSSCATPQRNKAQMGPMRAIFHRRLVLVVGTQGPLQRHLSNYAMILARRWFVEGGGVAEVVRDVDVDVNQLTPHHKMFNANLVLFGGPDTNSVTADIMRNYHHAGHDAVHFPSRGKLRVGKCWFNTTLEEGGSAHSFVMLGPWWGGQAEHHFALIMGDSPDTLREAFRLFLGEALTVNQWQHHTPEYIVGSHRHSVLADRVAMAGYFGNRWEWREDLAAVLVCHH